MLYLCYLLVIVTIFIFSIERRSLKRRIRALNKDDDILTKKLLEVNYKLKTYQDEYADCKTTKESLAKLVFSYKNDRAVLFEFYIRYKDVLEFDDDIDTLRILHEIEKIGGIHE